MTLLARVRGSIPDWLDERLGAMDSPDTLIDALNQQASLDLRVNPLKAERDAMLAELQQGAGRYQPVAMPYSPWGIRDGRASGHQPLARQPGERAHGSPGRGRSPPALLAGRAAAK